MPHAFGHEPTRGAFPRSFVIDATARWLIVGNDKSDRLDVFAIDEQKGTLSHVGELAGIARPAALRLIPIDR